MYSLCCDHTKKKKKIPSKLRVSLAEEVLWGWLSLLLFCFPREPESGFLGSCCRTRPLRSPPKPTCLPSADFLLFCRSSRSSFLLCRSSRTLPTLSHPTSDSVVAPSSFLLSSSSREALPNQKQLRQAVISRLISNTKRCLVAFILLPRLGPALIPLHPTPPNTPAFWVVAYPRKVIP